MRANYICDFCGNPLNQLRRIQINNWNDKEHKDCFETIIEADLCQKCSLSFEQEIRIKQMISIEEAEERITKLQNQLGK